MKLKTYSVQTSDRACKNKYKWIHHNSTLTQLTNPCTILQAQQIPLCGGGRVKTESSQSYLWTYPKEATPKGPIFLANPTHTDCSENPRWTPNQNLLTIRDDHPLDVLMTQKHLQMVKTYCTLSPTVALVYSHHHKCFQESPDPRNANHR